MTNHLQNDQQLYDEYNQLNSFELCYQGQELVQDLVSRTSDTLQTIRTTSIFLLYADQNNYNQRSSKLEELFKLFDLQLKRLRVIGSLIHNRKLALEQKERELNETITNGNQANLDQLKLEQENLKKQLKLKNSYIKLAIDKINDIIWNINSIQTIRK
jgi:hypothetical protein